uniref:Uncharacterized protein n=1 Tax=viral metagenome TaxID=1070528 RepID=A0A6C0AKL6_9ZZZZ
MSKTVPVAGTGSSVTFFEDDSLETVRQHIAVAVNSHPDRLFIEVHVQLPEKYYEDPRKWDALFMRMSIDGLRLDRDLFKYYLEHSRHGTGVKEAKYSREDWNARPVALDALYKPGAGFSEWWVFGVAGDRSIVLPRPPKELAFTSTRIPIGNMQLLFESLYSDVGEFRATEVNAEMTPAVKRVYFPLFREDTPSRLTDSAIRSLRTNAEQLTKLLALSVPEPRHPVILRAKWYLPLVETSFTAPRARFEQMFYGLTLSKDTPYVGFFTSKQEKTRHKFYVKDPSNKVPSIDVAMWKAWTTTTLPQRRLPTLLLYRGSSRSSFDRIAITPRDIQFTIVRGKESKKSLDDIRTDLYEWFKTLDGVTPFVELRDLDESRWELQDMSILGAYAKEVTEFDMRRFPCLQTVFSSQDDTFRLLRADRLAENFTPLQVQAFQALQEADMPSAQTLIEIGISPDDAEAMFRTFTNLGDDLDLDRVLKGFPTLRFSNKEVILSAVTNVDRALKYASILRHVLTAPEDDVAVNAVCPRRVEAVEASAAAAPQPVAVHAGEFAVDGDFLAELGLGAPEAAEVEAQPEAPTGAPKKRVRIADKNKSTYNYFNRRLQEFDPDTFDSTIYPSKCDKNKQVVVLTPEDEARIPPEYNPRNYPETEKQAKVKDANKDQEGIDDYNVHIIPLTNREGIATCPQYWCIKDELPLREDQLVDGACPVCKGKVRTGKDEDITEFSVMKRDQTSVFPNYIGTLKDKQIPCCYKVEQPFKKVMAPGSEKSDDSYILSSTKTPAMRMGYLPEGLAASLGIPIAYDKSIKKSRLDAGKADFFRVGLGRPSKTIPHFLKSKEAVPDPKDAPKNVMLCSFARSWTEMGEGVTQVDRIVAGIQHAYSEGRLTILDELEYVTSVVRCNVIRVDTATSTVKCGFWSEQLSPRERTIVLLDDDILAHVARGTDKAKGFAKYTYTINIRDPLFPKKMLVTMTTLHTRACASDRPRMSDALQELRSKGHTFQVILDPFDRVQAVFVPRVVILPVQPEPYEQLPGVQARSGYADIRPEELPTRQSERSFLDQTTHKGFKWVEDLQDVNDMFVESLLASEFRAPFQPEVAPHMVAKEVLSTMQRNPERDLTDGSPNAEDARLADSISYASEVFDFLMFSLSKDIQKDEYEQLRQGIATRGKTLYKQLDAWLKKEAHWDATQGPRPFINKVRTPCGQFQQKDACNTSSLCGWKAGKCKIKVDASVDRAQVLRRLTKTLVENDKQRALVLDERLSPFFSTVLYMEMPHELITTTV